MNCFRRRRHGAAATLFALIAFCAPAASRPADTGSERLSWVSVPGGCFEMGDENSYPEEGSAHEICIAQFELSRTEVTNRQFEQFVEATGYVTRAERGWRADEPGSPGIAIPPASAVFRPPSGGPIAELSWWQLVDGADWRHPTGPQSSAEPDWPVVHVTRDDAEAYAEWAGGRLPTEEEWEFAARGAGGNITMSLKEAERAELSAKANTWQGLFPVIDTGKDGYEGIAPVAQYPANRLGLYDMIGNVWEWTSTPYAPSHSRHDRERAGAQGLDPSQPGVPVGVIKGGSYLCAPNYCRRFRAASRQAQDLAFGTSHVGFRVAR